MEIILCRPVAMRASFNAMPMPAAAEHARARREGRRSVGGCVGAWAWAWAARTAVRPHNRMHTQHMCRTTPLRYPCGTYHAIRIHALATDTATHQRCHRG